MNQVARSPSALGPTQWALILVITLASALAINPYSYGVDDNSITIPFLKSSVNPALYPGDYFVAQRPYYYTYLWNALGQLHARLAIGLPVLFFATYLGALYLTFLGMYLIAFALFESREIAVLSLLFLLFSKATLADVRTIETTLNTREVATPLLLLAIYYFLKRDTLRPFLLLGLAYLIHPLTTNFVLAMLVVAALVRSRRSGFRPLLVGIPAFLLVSSPLLAWRLRHTPPSLHLFSADPQWVTALHHRSAHHVFPFAWGWTALVHALVLLLLFAIAWRHRNRENDDRHEVIGIATCTVLALCIIGVVGSELYPVGIVFISQPLRSFQFMEYFATLYVSHYFYRAMVQSERLVIALGVAAISGWIVYGADHQVIALLVFIAMASIMTTRHLLWRRDLAGAAFAMTTTGLVVLAACVCYAVDRSNENRTFSMVGDEESPWFDIQRWASAHTDVRDGFIVPPYEEPDFRVHGERTVYADIEEGGLMNFNPAFGKEWLRRMRMLGFAKPRGATSAPEELLWLDPARAKSEFCKLSIAEMRRIAGEMEGMNRRVFLVWPCSERVLPFPQKYRNDTYIIYEVS